MTIEQRTARKVLRLAAVKGAALREFHTPAAIVADEDTGDFDPFYVAVDALADQILPDRDFDAALRERGIQGDVAEQLWSLFHEYGSATQRAAFALGVAFAGGGR